MGCARIGGLFEGHSRLESVALLRRALDSGITFFDTADMYTQGASEALVGEAFEHLRDRVIIATKVGYRVPEKLRFLSRVKPALRPLVARLKLRSAGLPTALRTAPANQDFSATYLATAVEASLRRLRTDYIDIYQLHDPPRDVLAQGEFVPTLERLRAQGKIRQWGVAGQDPSDATCAVRLPGLSSMQIALSALEQAALTTALPVAGRAGLGIIARQVFASGLLTRDVRSVVASNLDPDAATAERKRMQLEQYAELAQQSGRTRVELALQFALSQRDVSVVLVGFSRLDQLSEALRAYDKPPLRGEERQRLTPSPHAGPQRASAGWAEAT